MTGPTDSDRIERLEKLRDEDHREIMDAILDVRNEVVGGRNEVSALREDFVDLKQYVNHEQTAMIQSMQSFRAEFIEKLDGKLSADQLLTSLGFRLLNNRWVRWAVGVIGFTAFGTFATDLWIRYGSVIHDAFRSLPPF